MKFTDRMPAHTQRAHFDPSWQGDRPAALKKTSRMRKGPDGIRAIDCNFQVAWKDPKNRAKGCEIWNMHWSTPLQNNYRWIYDAKRRRPRRMTLSELRRPIGLWPSDLVMAWRRGSKTSSERPRTYYEMALYARQHGVYITAEVKSSGFASPMVARKFVAEAKRAGHPPWAMGLFKSMPYCREKCAALRRAGASFAVIFGRFQRYRSAFYREVKSWPVQPTRVW